MAAPERLHIPYDDVFDGQSAAVGRLPDGTQFVAFVAGAFPGEPRYYVGDDRQVRRRWLAVIHRFDADGNHQRSEARLGGFDIEGREAAGDKAFQELRSLYSEMAAEGEPTFCDIWVKPFAVEIDGVTHGLIYERCTEGATREGECVRLEPWDIMFHQPWDSGEYST